MPERDWRPGEGGTVDRPPTTPAHPAQDSERPTGPAATALPAIRDWMRIYSLRWRDRQLRRHPMDGDRLYALRHRKADREPFVPETAFGGPGPAAPIDFVFSWVDGDDPEFRRSVARFSREARSHAEFPARFSSRDKLRYALRSVQAFAPWYNRIFLVTNGQIPDWLREHERLTAIRHEQILAPACLPTFNSHVIESALHNIPGLSEHYVYFNDDMLLTRPAAPGHFFTADGSALIYGTDRNLDRGPAAAADTDTDRAAKNARDLIRRHWGREVRRMCAHICVPQLRSVATANERTFAGEYANFRGNRFRHESDIYCTGFLNPHRAHLESRARLTRARWSLIAIRDLWAARHYHELLRARSTGAAPFALCLHDSASAASPLPDFEARMHGFLRDYFPAPSPFEKGE